MNTELFTGKAEQYAMARPGYPIGAIDYICSLVPADAIFADIGAGTGIFTQEIAKRGYTIYAIEPNSDMLEQLKTTANQYKSVKIISAPAEATTLPDKSVDIIICAQALHWFDLMAYEKECKRIGKPGVIVAAVYNITHGGSSITHSKLAQDEFFKNPTIKEFPNPIFYTREKWIAYMTSHSHDPLPTDPEYDEHIAKVNAMFDEESIDGLLCREVVTKVYFEKMDKQEVARQIYKAAYITGEFELRSGKISNEYFDKYLFESKPGLLVEIARIMKSLIPVNTEIIAGLEMGGIPIVTALSIESNIPSVFVRKIAKKYGTCKLAEGSDIENKKVCVIEDVVTTGGQIVESVKELRKRGAIIDTVLCVILRDEKAIEILSNEGLKILPAFTMDYLKEQK